MCAACCAVGKFFYLLGGIWLVGNGSSFCTLGLVRRRGGEQRVCLACCAMGKFSYLSIGIRPVGNGSCLSQSVQFSPKPIDNLGSTLC